MRIVMLIAPCRHASKCTMCLITCHANICQKVSTYGWANFWKVSCLNLFARCQDLHQGVWYEFTWQETINHASSIFWIVFRCSTQYFHFGGLLINLSDALFAIGQKFQENLLGSWCFGSLNFWTGQSYDCLKSWQLLIHQSIKMSRKSSHVTDELIPLRIFFTPLIDQLSRGKDLVIANFGL